VRAWKSHLSRCEVGPERQVIVTTAAGRRQPRGGGKWLLVLRRSPAAARRLLPGRLAADNHGAIRLTNRRGARGTRGQEEYLMKRLIGRAGAIALLAISTVSAASAQGKIRIAIWDFENNAEHSWWGWDRLGPAARNNIDTAFSENPVLSEKFSIIEREKLDMIMKEQGLGAAGALDPQTAAKVGKVLGIKYILTGAIDKFSINTTKGGFGGVGGSMTKAEATINIRIVDTTTAERLVALSADGDVKKGGGFAKGASLSQENEWGIASEAVEKASKAVAEKFATGGYIEKLSTAGGGPSASEGKIVKVEGNKAWLNIGQSFGVKVGDKYTVVSVGEALVDPDSGMALGAEMKDTGSGEVIEVQDRFAIMTFTGKAKAKDVVKKVK
jgi:curli biogenesis system outer membrane secretion channel CsgG